mmetsp:Transcript_128181/g.371131  ORF Transcript_128181/g.371131 Transcript_128181/m.371131 type:complete len:153 (-) Transcript_128181:237-695(-)
MSCCATWRTSITSRRSWSERRAKSCEFSLMRVGLSLGSLSGKRSARTAITTGTAPSLPGRTRTSIGVSIGIYYQAPGVKILSPSAASQSTASASVLRRRGYGSTCYLAIQGGGNPRTWKLGAPFLRKFYVLFDSLKKRVGIALAKPESDNFV